MKIELYTPGIESDEMIRQFMHSRIGESLGNYQDRVERLKLTLTDESRGSKAFDGLCKVDLWMHPQGRLHVSGRGESAYETVLNAITKIEHALRHEIDRGRQADRIRHEKSKRQFNSELAGERISQVSTQVDQQ